MSPARTGPGGNFRFDRVFPGVGRIAASSGTRRLSEYRKRDALLSRLYEKPRLDLLRALKDGTLTIQELLEADRLDALGSVTADLIGRRPLWPTVDATLPLMARGAATRRRYRYSLEALKAAGALTRAAKVADLARVDWTALERAWGHSPADWMHLRRAVSRFLAVALGDVYHPLRRQVMRLIPRRREPHRVPDVQPADFRAIVAQTPRPLQPAYWTLALTGARLGELLHLTKADVNPAAHTVRIRSSKTDTDASDRVLPVVPRLFGWVEAAVPVPVTEWTLRYHWYRACEAAGYAKVRLHDLRHFTGQTLADAGRSEASIGRFLGQTTPAITRRYTDRKLRQGDAEALAGALVPLPTAKKRGAK